MDNRVEKKCAYQLEASSHTSKCKAKCIILISLRNSMEPKVKLIVCLRELGMGWDQSATTISEGME
jgi:hypothetical protein